MNMLATYGIVLQRRQVVLVLVTPTKPLLVCSISWFSMHLRYMGVIWFLFLINPLYLISMWLSEDHRANTIKTHVEKRLDYIYEY
jgi:hypothetical protein